MKYYVWYDIWTTNEERAFQDGRTISITISPKDH